MGVENVEVLETNYKKDHQQEVRLIYAKRSFAQYNEYYIRTKICKRSLQFLHIYGLVLLIKVFSHCRCLLADTLL